MKYYHTTLNDLDYLFEDLTEQEMATIKGGTIFRVDLDSDDPPIILPERPPCNVCANRTPPPRGQRNKPNRPLQKLPA
jgi:hypothetical protein